MKKSAVLVFVLLLSFVSAEASEKNPYEMPRTQVVPIQDTKSDRQYELYIKLPEDYEKNTEVKYPVIYTGDAAWHMDMLSGSTEYLMSEVILVGISWQKDIDQNTAFRTDDEWVHASRARDYTVVPSNNPEYQAIYQYGRADDHLSFIRDDVINYVESHYRTDPSDRTYFGYSLGSVLGAYILFAEPDTFKYYILGSPAFGQKSFDYIDEFEASMAPEQTVRNANVFVSVGELERPNRIALTKDFVSVLERRSGAGLKLTALEMIENSNHGTAFPVTVIRSIKWLSELKSK